jgi:hypothetical protein
MKSKGRVLIMTTLNDSSIKQVRDFLLRNKYKKPDIQEIKIRLHPLDNKKRWESISRKFLQVKIVSGGSMMADVIGSSVHYAVDSTVVLQLRAISIDVKMLSKKSWI